MWKNTQHAHFAEICTNRAPVCVRGVDGSCAKHLTAHVESYTVVMLLTVILIIIITISSPTPLTVSFRA